jgi:hypothetical protein
MTTHNLTTLGSSTAVRLTPNGLHSGLTVTVQNTDASNFVYLGGEGVTTTAYGLKLIPGAIVSLDLNGLDALYAIASASNTKAAVLITSLVVGS